MSSSLGKGRASPSAENNPRTPIRQDSEAGGKSAPRSVPDDSEHESDQGEGEMVPAAGRINEKGEVIDDDGQAIGKVTNGDASKLVGLIVTQEGDILDHEGGVVGKAEPLEDVASELGNYTTGNKQQSGGGGGLGSALGGIGKSLGGVTGGLGKTAKGVTGAVGDKTKDVTDGLGDTTGTKDVTGKLGDTAKGVTDTAGEATQGVTDTAGDATEDATGAVGDATKPVDDVAGQATGGATDKVGETAGDAAGAVGDAAGDATEKVSDVAGDATSKVGDVAGDATGKSGDVTSEPADNAGQAAGDATDKAGQAAQDVTGEAGRAADDATGEVEQAAQKAIQIPEFAPSVAQKVVNMFEGPFKVSDNGQVQDQNGRVLGHLANGVDFQSLIGKDIKGIDEYGQLMGDNDTVLGKVDLVPEGSIVGRIREEEPRAAERLDAIDEANSKLPPVSILEGLKINKAGNVVDEKGNVMGRVKSGDVRKLVGLMPDDEGRVFSSNGKQIGEVEVVPDAIENSQSPFEDFPDAIVEQDGKVYAQGREIGYVDGDVDISKLVGKKVDADGDVLDKNGNVVGKAIRADPTEAKAPEIDYSVLVGKKVNKAGNVVDDKGNVWGQVVEGILKNMIGKKVGDNGEIFNDAGKVIGKCEPLREGDRADATEAGPFEDFPGALVADKGVVMYNNEQVGIVVEGDAKKLKGKAVDADGEILDKNGNVLGRAERWEPEEAEPEPEVDRSILAGKRINKAGNAVDKHGDIYGRVIEGDLQRLIGKMCDKEGYIRNEGGDPIGRAEIIPEAEREGMREGPFTDLPGCTVTKEGHVVTPGGDIVGRLVSGDPKVLFGRAVDDDGDILDKNGNVLGKAERWQPEEVQKEVHPASGRKVNKEGKVVDENGDVMALLTSGDLPQCIGKKIDDNGNVVDGSGNILGHVSLLEEIPSDASPMSGRKVNDEGNVCDENGNVIGKLTSGELSQCAGKKVDNDANVVDSKGNVLGHCSLLSEIPENTNPMAGLLVNKEGNVINDQGEVLGKLTSGDLLICAGKKVDNDGDVVDAKGSIVGHVSLLQDIPEEEVEEPVAEETDEQKTERLALEQDVRIAARICQCLEHSLDKIRPICKMITTRIEQEEAKKEVERDQDELVKQVQPLIEEGGKILTEANGVIRGLDPDGRIQAGAKQRSYNREATPEEHKLAELLKELGGTITETIDNAKKKLASMPKAEKAINPLWGLLAEPLAQIVAAVGLLLSGVLGLLGQILGCIPGLGPIVKNLLGGLGLTKILDGLGLGSVLKPLTGGGDKKKSGGGGKFLGIL